MSTDLQKRLLTGIVLIGLLVLCLKLGGYYLTFVAIAAIYLCALEFISFAGQGGKLFRYTMAAVFITPGLGAALVGWSSFSFIFIACAILVFAQSLFLVERSVIDQRSIKNVNAILIGFLYIGLFGGILIYITSAANAVKLVTWLFSGVIASDTFAYFGGKAFGKKQLAPQISPKKTIAGMYFGYFGCIGACMIVANYYNFVPRDGWNYQLLLLFFASLVASLSLMGDLFESLLKRIHGVKDSGRFLPGHGGLLDRLDALVLSAPVAILMDIFIKGNH
ncbi:MAG: phosphatidate cytidylyltransferase [Deltaproteobacteria bacterium]|nr:phosphatidate cytidylyltransferase [Deltaproteobacteria bacterium]